MWQEQLVEFIGQIRHPSWGTAHSKRIYALALEMAGAEGMAVDADLLFAAACLHDLGALPPYRQAGVDHAERSAELAGSILVPMGFPVDQVAAVEEIIRGHMFSADPGPRPEAIVFHDADTLDFLGAIGIARLIAVVELADWAPDLPSAVKRAEKFCEELPARLYTATARRLGHIRQAEMRVYLEALAGETARFEVL